MRKTLLILALLIAVTGFASAADLTGFHSSPTDRAIGSLAITGAGQGVTLTYSDSTVDAKIALGETSISLSSIQIFGDAGEGFLNFYTQETVSYAFGGSYSVNGVSEVITDAAGYFFSATMGVSTNLPTFVEGLEIMAGLGYHLDCGYAAMTYGTNGLTGLFDLSLAGLGLNLVADYALLGDFGLSLSIDWSVDFYSLTIPLSGFSTTVDDIIATPGMNFGIAVGISIPMALADEFAVETY
ncbi:MAG: hypothetical protein JEZ04_07705 [Spirochaetales bacterium]|nr:hypothetical protein [Spirochaetales bacterium]